MTPTEHAVIQQALEHKRSCAYKRIDQNPSECTCGVTEALTALQEALAEQAKQEPVGYFYDQSAIEMNGWKAQKDRFSPVDPTIIPLKSVCNVRPLYAAPVRTKDLTDDEIAQAVGSPLDEVYLADFRAVIAADREKNK